MYNIPAELIFILNRARILKHFKVTAEKIALGKVNFSNGILKQPDFSLTAVCHCGQETYSLATGLNKAVLVTLLERQLMCLRIPKMQVWLERYLFNRKVVFSTFMKCLRIGLRARILKHFKVTAEKIALEKVNFSNGFLKQPDFSLTAVCHCSQETFSLATGLN